MSSPRFSILQLTTSPSREDGLNIGLLLHDEKGFSLKLGTGFANRAQAAFGNMVGEAAWLQESAAMLKRQLEELPAEKRSFEFVRGILGTKFRLTLPRNYIGGYEAQDALMRTLVEVSKPPRRKTESRVRVRQVVGYLQNQFTPAMLDGRVTAKKKYDLPFRDKSFVADFSWQNGNPRVISTAWLSKDGWFKDVEHWAATARQLDKHADGAKLTTLLSVDSTSFLPDAMNYLRDMDVEPVHADNSAELEHFVSDVMVHAK